MVTQVNKGFIGVCRRATMISMEENKYIVLDTKTGRKIPAGHDLCEDFLKEEIWEDLLIG